VSASRLLNEVLVTMSLEPQPDEIKPHVNTIELKAILVVDDDKQLASALQWIEQTHFRRIPRMLTKKLEKTV
jgi:hypothetical protein